MPDLLILTGSAALADPKLTIKSIPRSIFFQHKIYLQALEVLVMTAFL